MSFGPKGGQAGVPYTPAMWEAFREEMAIAAEGLKRREEKPQPKPKESDDGQH